MKKNLVGAILALTVCIIAACNPLPSVIFRDGSCTPPCWNHLTPGQTLAKDIYTQLKSISAVDSKSIKTISRIQANDDITFKFLPNFREINGDIFSQGGTLDAISFAIKPDRLNLSEILQEWGPPDQYISVYYSKAEIPYLATSIIYAKRGIILENIKNMSAEEVPKFESSFLIQSIWFTKPLSITAPLQNGLLDVLDAQDLQEGLKPWDGLGEIHYLKKDLFGFK